MGGAHSPLWEIQGIYGDPAGAARQAMGHEAFERARADGFATATEKVGAEVLQGRDADTGRATQV